MGLPKYQQARRVNLPWLKSIPDHWKLTSLRHGLSYIRNGSTAQQVDNGADTIPITRIETISKGVIDWTKVGQVMATDVPTSFLLNQDDLLLSHINSLPMVGNVAHYRSTKLLAHGMNLLRLSVSKNSDSRFIFYWLKSKEVRSEIESRAKPAINQASISIDSIKQLPLLIPSLSEQQKIAQFLDYETAKIDALIDEQKRLIELLKEKRQAVVNHAVTKGLNPDAPMKDSGVVWLGEVPEHWKVLRVKFLSSKVSTGGTPTQPPPSEEYDDGLNWFSPGDFKDSLMLINSKKKLDRDSLVSNNAMIFPANSVLVVGIGATLGKVAITSEKFSTNQQVNIISPSKSVSKEFLAYSLSVKREAMKVLSNASTIGIMNQEKTKEIPVPIPTFGEQESIHLYIGKELEKLSLLVESTKTNIDLLKERRSALISAAVTGKIDVRDWQPPAGSDTVDSNAPMQTERHYG